MTVTEPAAARLAMTADHMSISLSLRLSRGRPVVGGRLAQLPDLGGTQLVDGLVDQVRGLKLVAGLEIGLDVAYQVGVPAALRHLVAHLIPVAQGRVRVGEVVSGP